MAMIDFVKKIHKHCADDLEPGEEVLAATFGQPPGAIRRQVAFGAIGGAVGAVAGEAMAMTKIQMVSDTEALGLGLHVLQLGFGLGHHVVRCPVDEVLVAQLALEPLDDLGDPLVSEVGEMAQRLLGGMVVVEDQVGDPGQLLVSGDGDGGQPRLLVDGRRHLDEAFDRTVPEQIEVLGTQILARLVTGNEVEVARTPQMVLDAAQDAAGVALADLGDQDTDGVAALVAQRPGHVVGPIVELAGRLEHPILGLLGDRLGHRGTVDDERNRCRRQIEVLRHRLERDPLLAPRGR